MDYVALLGMFAAGMVGANFVEWAIHRYLLHGLGKNKDSMWSFHWHGHHRACRRNFNLDDDYTLGFQHNVTSPEARGLFALACIPLTFVAFAPAAAAGVWFHITLYWFLHKKSHVDKRFTDLQMAWHYDHHMGKNQDSNWCVTYPLADYVLRTRERYRGTERHRRDIQKGVR